MKILLIDSNILWITNARVSSKVLQYFDNVKHNSIVLDTFLVQVTLTCWSVPNNDFSVIITQKKILRKQSNYKGGLKSSCDDVISAVDDFFDQWDPSTAMRMEEVYRP